MKPISHLIWEWELCIWQYSWTNDEPTHCHISATLGLSEVRLFIFNMPRSTAFPCDSTIYIYSVPHCGISTYSHNFHSIALCDFSTFKSNVCFNMIVNLTFCVPQALSLIPIMYFVYLYSMSRINAQNQMASLYHHTIDIFTALNKKKDYWINLELSRSWIQVAHVLWWGK